MTEKRVLAFKKKLIKLVKARPLLYDPLVKKFTDFKAKDDAWQDIANEMGVEVEICRNIWVDLRLRYQEYARSLRNFFKTGMVNNTNRPTMPFEKEMLFLWRLVGDEPPYTPPPKCTPQPVPVVLASNISTHEVKLQATSVPKANFVAREQKPYTPRMTNVEFSPLEKTPPLCRMTGKKSLSHEVRSNTEKVTVDSQPTISSIRNNNEETTLDNDGDIILIEEAIPFIEILSDDEEVTLGSEIFYDKREENRKLILLISQYPELYDPTHRLHFTYSHRISLWKRIGLCMHTKIMKAQKTWKYLYTRYECKSKTRKKNLHDSQLACEKKFLVFLKYLEPHIDKNTTNSIYEQSLYLKTEWHEPIRGFRENTKFLRLITGRFPSIIGLTETAIQNKTHDDAKCHITWEFIAKVHGLTPGQCEVSWLMLRSFFLELKYMALAGVGVNEKWSLESLIEEVYTSTLGIKMVWQLEESPCDSIQPVNHDADAINSSNVTITPPSDTMESQRYSDGGSLNKRLKLDNAVMRTKQTKITSYSQPKQAIDTGSNIPIINLVDNDDDDADDDTSSTPNYSSLKIFRKIGTIGAPNQDPLWELLFYCKNFSHFQTSAKRPPDDHQSLRTSATYIASLKGYNAKFTIVLQRKTNNDFKFIIKKPLSIDRYQVPKHVIINVIQNILSIPLLHQSSASNDEKRPFWQIISSRNNLPVCLCLLLWHFIGDNFKYLDEIAPIIELMTPVEPKIMEWTLSDKLFADFQECAVKHGFYDKRAEIPSVIQICLSSDIFLTPTDSHQHFWKLLNEIFPKIENLRKVWTILRDVYHSYLDDLERGIDNKWPIEWWQTFAEMTFLANFRYKSNQPLNLIIQHKISEEIARCAAKEKQQK